MAERLTISDIRQHQREGFQFHPSSYSARLEDTAIAALAEVESLRTQLAAARAEIERMPLVDAMIPAFVDDPVAHRLGFHDADCDGNHDASTARAQAVMDLESDLAAVRTDLSEARRLLDRFATGYCLSDLEMMAEELSDSERALLAELAEANR